MVKVTPASFDANCRISLIYMNFTKDGGIANTVQKKVCTFALFKKLGVINCRTFQY